MITTFLHGFAFVMDTLEPTNDSFVGGGKKLSLHIELHSFQLVSTVLSDLSLQLLLRLTQQAQQSQLFAVLV